MEYILFVWCVGWIAYLLLTVHKHRKAIDGLTDAHNANCESIRILRRNLMAIHDMGPVTCKICGGNLFVCIEDDWLCKSCRQPAPEAFAAQLDRPEERTLN